MVSTRVGCSDKPLVRFSLKIALFSWTLGAGLLALEISRSSSW
jgi:hypothetical protein